MLGYWSPILGASTHVGGPHMWAFLKIGVRLHIYT